MDSPTPASVAFGKEEVEAWIREARAGSTTALGLLIEASRSYLLSIANRSLPHALQAKLGASDLVQETSLEAHRDFSSFQGERLEELLAWLRRILLNNAANVSRHFEKTEKRSVSRELGWEAAAHQVATARDETPSPCAHLISREQQQGLESALAQLPIDMRKAIELRNKEHLSFEEIGERMDRTAAAARKLWVRAVERLQVFIVRHDSTDRD